MLTQQSQGGGFPSLTCPPFYPMTARKRLPIRALLADPVTREEIMIGAVQFLTATEGREYTREEARAVIRATTTT